ncbi:MAG: YlxR family protein [Lachnospiraceae bacterium]|jgi:predicted RNA-binding protein YlxR (DUF448 family)|uniref:RNase P modulator RnpM n=1 Tax=Clostridium sp. (strain SY8519) TaxID=1042156 RepID=UPI0002171C14|nr:YlxR family protein [Clostridium sp. SY8519]MCI1654386.1 YlxR family protein [Lachnospiraceae bacterium]MCI1656650.1 YlxR family protein [Lachnospiraceae bacterium]MCI2195342.1 YlxR family protein [Lachnospiraceae bacterium]BAK48306.1 hypothetical protein CXIVA_23390 [Clostridium sp. SY8519]HAD20342.1 DUF448 domain-containing protein [Lachnospiraceae bacterium]
MGKKVPMRVCVGCRQLKEKKELIRILHTAEDGFCVDARGRKNGRGAYICKNRACLEAAVKNHGLERSLKTHISKEIWQALIKEMEKEIAEQ